MLLRRDARKISWGFLAFAVLGLGLLTGAPVCAQVTGATLTGTVTDASGAVVPQTQISIKNIATGVGTTVMSDTAGFYSVPNLLPGKYEVSASAPGFSTDVHSGITLNVGARQVLNFALQVGQTNQTIEVTSTAPNIELATSSINAVVTSQTVVELPLNGRDWTQLANLQPAVQSLPTQASVVGGIGGRGNRGFGNQLTISGTRPQMNNYRLDGISIVDFAGGSPGNVVGAALGVDAIAEFSVLTANYDAEYGRTAGGVVNAVTRSGTNMIHGDAFEFLRNSSLDARNFFDGKKIPPFRRNQFGGSVGGPILKDKTFFFADYEGLRQARDTTTVDNVPSPDARNGIIHNADGTTCTIGIPSPGCALTNTAGTVGVDPLVKPYLAFYGLPNGGLNAPGNTGKFDVAVNAVSYENFVTARIDHKISAKDSIFGTWFYDSGRFSEPEPLDTWIISDTSKRQGVVLEETHTFSSSLVNSLRGGYSRVANAINQGTQAINPVASDLSLGAFPGHTAPRLQVTGLTPTTGGLNGTSLIFPTWNSFQAYDDAFITKGVHSIKMGFAFERMQTNIQIAPSPSGLFSFGSLTAFLTNQPHTFSGILPSAPPPEIGARQSLFGGYVQDDWRLRPSLTLNFGLRYEMVTVPTAVNNMLTNLMTFTSPTPHLGSPFFNNPTKRNFEPRVGFSWDPFHDGKTAIRGAFGIMDILPLDSNFFIGQAQAAPFSVIASAGNLPAGSFPTGAVAIASVPSKLTNESVQFNPPRNYLMIWNLNVQRQLTASTAMTIGYVGNHGVHMLDRADDVNSVLPVSTTPTGLLFPFPAGSGTVLNPNSGDIRGLYWDGDAEYDALEVQVTKRMSHGFQAQAAYTWGKSIDEGTASGIGDPFQNSISSLFWFCKSCRRGLSDLNIAQTLVVNYIWDVPTPKNWGSVGSHVLGGWELGGILTVETGVPMTVLIGGDPLGLNSTDPYAFPNRLTGAGCGSDVNPGNPNNYIKLNCFALPAATAAIAAQCTPFAAAPGTCSNLVGDAGRNSVVGPGLLDFDFSLFKNNYIRKISESFNVQFRAEFFNILNHPNFEPPISNDALFDSNGNPVGGAGAINQTSTTAREIQFALKFIW